MAATIDKHARLLIIRDRAWGNCTQRRLMLGYSMPQACQPHHCRVAQASRQWRLGWHQSQL